jgi:hypothetical protein
MNLSDSLEEYLSDQGTALTAAESAQVAALRLTARTLDGQDAEPLASLLSTYMRELARFQKNRANKPAASAMAKALAGLANDTDHD